jgi:NADPH:quinone reductase-like Zn-dependent oxidoreductase
MMMAVQRSHCSSKREIDYYLNLSPPTHPSINHSSFNPIPTMMEQMRSTMAKKVHHREHDAKRSTNTAAAAAVSSYPVKNHPYRLETEDRNPSFTHQDDDAQDEEQRCHASSVLALTPRIEGYSGRSNSTNSHGDSSSGEDLLQQQRQLYQRKVEYRQFGANAHDLLRIVEEPGIPCPAYDDHVIIRVEASTVTLEDCAIRRGFDFDIFHPTAVPVTPGTDVVGRIVAIGSAVGEHGQVPFPFALHDRVAALVRSGGNARYASVPSNRLVRLPAGVDFDAAEAVAMVSIYTTAYQTLKRIKQKKNLSILSDHANNNSHNGKPSKEETNLNVFSLAGSTVLVIGGMNAVGQALLQMCQKAKADKIYATGPVHRHSYLQHVLGAIPLPETGWLEQQKYDIEGRMDYVFDGVNEDIWLDTSYRALKPLTGELVCYGHTAMLREQHMGVLGAPITAHINKLWSHTLPRAQMLEIGESFRQDPETYKVSTSAGLLPSMPFFSNIGSSPVRLSILSINRKTSSRYSSC